MVNKRMSDAKARKLALGEGGGMPYLRTHQRADASRAIINLEQNDRMIELLEQIARQNNLMVELLGQTSRDASATREAMEYIARNTPVVSRP